MPYINVSFPGETHSNTDRKSMFQPERSGFKTLEITDLLHLITLQKPLFALSLNFEIVANAL